jgi:chromatin segregation and condensation protein Rec8/ScpA/Scc1 (kleisin family)
MWQVLASVWQSREGEASLHTRIKMGDITSIRRAIGQVFTRLETRTLMRFSSALSIWLDTGLFSTWSILHVIFCRRSSTALIWVLVMVVFSVWLEAIRQLLLMLVIQILQQHFLKLLLPSVF